MGNLKVGGVSVIGGVACKCPQGTCSPTAEVNAGLGTVVCRVTKPIATMPSNAEERLVARPDTSDFRVVASGHINNLPNLARFMGKE